MKSLSFFNKVPRAEYSSGLSARFALTMLLMFLLCIVSYGQKKGTANPANGTPSGQIITPGAGNPTLDVNKFLVNTSDGYQAKQGYKFFKNRSGDLFVVPQNFKPAPKGTQLVIEHGTIIKVGCFCSSKKGSCGFLYFRNKVRCRDKGCSGDCEMAITDVVVAPTN